MTSQILVSIPVLFLYEIGILIAKRQKQTRKEKQEMTYRHLLYFFLAFSILLLSAQTTTVHGRVFDGEPENHFLCICKFCKEQIGTTTDLDGMYELSTDKKVSRIQISFLGYHPQNISIQKQVSQKLDIALEPKRIDLAVAEVRRIKKKNPAKPLMQRVATAKDSNNPSLIPAVSHKFHERVEMDLNDIPSMLPNRKFWGAFGWVWEPSPLKQG